MAIVLMSKVTVVFNTMDDTFRARGLRCQMSQILLALKLHDYKEEFYSLLW